MTKKISGFKEHGIPSGGWALFFYMGLENSVNGWFVTYLKRYRLYVHKSCDCDGIRDLDHDHDRKDRHCVHLKERAAGKDSGSDLRTPVCLGIDPCLRGSYHNGSGGPDPFRTWNGGGVSDNYGLYRRSHGKFPTWNVSVYRDRFPRRDPYPQVIGVLADKLGFQAAILFFSAGRIPAGTFWSRGL